MAEQNPAIFLQSGTHPAEDVRRALGLIAQNRRGVAQETATFTDLKVQQAGTPNMTVDVLSGRCAISGTEGGF